MAPPIILCLVYVFIIYLSLFADPAWDFHIKFETFLVLIIGISSMISGALISRAANSFTRKQKYAFLHDDLKEIKIYSPTFLFLMSTVIFVISIAGIMNQARIILGNGGISSLIYAYRMSILTGTNNLPSIISNLILVNYALGYIILYVIINNWFVLSKLDKKLIPFVIYPTITGLFQGARGNLVQYFLFGITIFYYFYMVKKQKKHIDINLMLKIITALAVGVILFYILKTALGRDNQVKFIEYIGGLLCAPVKLLDVYISERHSNSSIWGLETFTNFISTIRRWQGQPGIRYGEYANFRLINGISFGNVYTAFRAYYADFKMEGVIILSGIIGLFTGNFYERFRRKRRTGIINFNLFLYSYLVYGIAMMFYSNTFYEYVANISFLKMIIVWGIINHIFLKNKIKIRIKY